MDDLNIINRRKYPRRRYRRPVGILHKGKLIVCKGEEIGEGGLLIYTEHLIPAGDQVLATIFIPGSGDIAIVRSEIRYQYPTQKSGEYQVGLQFTNFGFKHKKRIRDYIAAKSEAEAISDQQVS